MRSRAQRRKLERSLLKNKNNKTENLSLLYKIKYSLSEYQAQILLDKADTKLCGNLFPETYNEIREYGKTYLKNDILKELKWYLKEISNNAETINKFIELENEYENCFISGKYTLAENLLFKIENEICVSDWSIENRLLLAEYSGGFKANKNILAKILDDKNDPLTNIIARHQSFKVEKQTSYTKYNTDFFNLTKDLKQFVSDYLRYKLNFFSKLSYKSIGALLCIENSTTIIDKYRIFINIVMLIYCDEQQYNDIRTSVGEMLQQLNKIINDNRIRNIMIINNPTFLSNITLSSKDTEILEILDEYTKGNYEKSLTILQNTFHKNQNIFVLYLIYCKLYIYLDKTFEVPFDEGSLTNIILNHIYNILLKNEESQPSLLSLRKIVHSLGNTSFSLQLFDFIASQTKEKETVNLKKLSFFSAKFLNPNFVFLLKDFTYNFLEKRELQKSTTFRLLYKLKINDDLLNNEKDVEEYRLKKFELKNSIRLKKFEKSLQLLKCLEEDKYRKYNNISFNYIDFINNKITCYYELSDLQNALNEVVEANLINTNYKHGFNVSKLIKACLENNNLKSNINSPILLHQYLHLLDTTKKLWIAVDNFLSKNGLRYPKDVLSLQNCISEKKLIYFLKNVCIQDVYDSSTWFESKDDLDIERIEICTLLSDLDKENFEEYINEISEIDRQLLIKKGVKQIDESKIYVDVMGLKRSLYKDLNESLQRSLNLQSLPIEQIQKLDLQESSVLITYFDQNAKGSEQIDQSIKITGYSRFQHFEEMFCKVRDNFIANNEYGIDTYLSMRIRHGTLLGELRSIFEKYHLITKKEDTSSKYKENLYWEKIEINDIRIRNLFNDLLSAFSMKIDTISNRLKNEKIQIKTEIKATEGFFDYSYTQNDLLFLFKKKFGAINNTDTFIEEILNVLWQRTENNLKVIRDYISNDMKNEIIGYLSDLHRELDNILDKQQYSEYNELVRNITTCQTDVRNELDKIASWFKRTNSKSINDFNIDLPIDATLKTVKRIYKEYGELKVNKVIKSHNRIEGEFFQHFCYIFQNLIHNILEHSKLDSDSLIIKIEIQENEKDLEIEIENNFSEKVSIEELTEKISETKKLLDSEKNSDKIRAESGTGYLKIQKTLYHDLKRSSFEILINIIEETNIFKTTIKMDKINLFKN